MAQDRDYWNSLENAALNLRIPQTMELVNLEERDLQEGLDVD